MYMVSQVTTAHSENWGNVILSVTVISTHCKKPLTAPNGEKWNRFSEASIQLPMSMPGVNHVYKLAKIPDPS